MDQVNSPDHHYMIKMVPEENYSARVYWTDNKGQGPEARRLVYRSNRRDGGRGGECVRTKTLDNTNLMIGDQSKKQFKVICKHDIM